MRCNKLLHTILHHSFNHFQHLWCRLPIWPMSSLKICWVISLKVLRDKFLLPFFTSVQFRLLSFRSGSHGSGCFSSLWRGQVEGFKAEAIRSQYTESADWTQARWVTRQSFLIAGYLGEIFMKLPWAHLKEERAVVKIKDLYLLTGPKLIKVD